VLTDCFLNFPETPYAKPAHINTQPEILIFKRINQALHDNKTWETRQYQRFGNATTLHSHLKMTRAHPSRSDLKYLYANNILCAQV
jgi:hypothetical protein